MKKEDALLLLDKASSALRVFAGKIKEGYNPGEIIYQRELLYRILIHTAHTYKNFPFPEKDTEYKSLFVLVPGNVPLVPFQVLPISIVYNLRTFFKLPHNEKRFFLEFMKFFEEGRDFIQSGYLSHEEALEKAREYDFVFIFGGRKAYEIAERLKNPLRVFGPRFSIGYVREEETRDEVIEKIAFDNLAFDTGGCLSLRILFVEKIPALSIFKESYKKISRILPPQSDFNRDLFEYGKSVLVMESLDFISGNDWAVFYVKEIPDIWPPRTLFVMEARTPRDVLAILKELRYNLQGITGGSEKVFEYFKDTSTSYFSLFGRLQFPPSWWLFEKGIDINNIFEG